MLDRPSLFSLARGTKFRRGAIVALGVCLLFLMAAGASALRYNSSSSGVLVFDDGSGSIDRLDGATLRGNVFISLDTAIEASAVRFYIGPERQDSNYRGVDHDAPFNLFEDAANVPQPLDVDTLGSGEHFIWATYKTAAGWRHAGHRVAVQGAEPPPPPGSVPVVVVPGPSDIPAGSGVLLATDAAGETVRLNGGAVSGMVRIWLDPGVNASQVRFYVGEERESPNLRRVDYSAPFDLGAQESGTPLVSAASLGTVIYATYNDNGAWRHVRHDFSQQAGAAPAPAIQEPPTTPPQAAPTPPAPTPPAPSPPVPPSAPTSAPATSTTSPPTTGPAPTVTTLPITPSTTAAPTTAPRAPTPSPRVTASDIVVAPGASGSGSLTDPASLRSVLASSSIEPGTTVWLRGGTYVGVFESISDGREGNPITVRSYPGEKAVIDGKAATGDPTVSIKGDWQTWTDLEFTNSSGSRFLGQGTSRPTLLHVLGKGAAIINNSIHDGGNCIGWWKSAYDSVVYGNLIYNCGWDSGDRPHGHALYIQNLDDGRKLFEHNLVSTTFGRAFLVYGSDQAHNIDALGNVFAGGESLGTESKASVYIAAGVEDFNFVGNHVYAPEKESVSLVEGGPTIRFDDNYLMSKSDALAAIWIRGHRYVTGSGNHIASNKVQIRLENTGGFAGWDSNTYYGPDQFYPGSNLADWRRRTGQDGNSTVRTGTPNHVAVSANRYDDDRGLVTIWNGSGQSSVAVDVSSILEVGDRYKIVGGQDLGGSPILAGTYSGAPLTFPMSGRSVGSAIGGPTPAPWGAEFGTFAILAD